MKTIALQVVLLLVVAMMAVSCGKKQTAEEIPTATTQTQTPAQTDTGNQAQPEQLTQFQESELRTVYFDFDRYSLRSDSKSALDANAALLKQFPEVRIQIEGHCDERGTVEYNLSLGEKRANSCVDYLIGMGISPNRLSTISYGEERPAASGSNEASWAKNRRAEFKVVSPQMPM